MMKEGAMLNLNELINLHRKLEFLHRQSISDYWDENHENDLLRCLSLRQINHLLTIQSYGPCSLQTIMQHTGLSSSAVSAAVDKLVKAGVVDRAQNQENRREALVSLTPNIQRHLKQIHDRFCARISEILSDCSDEEAGIINKSAQILSRKLKKIQD